MIIDRAKGNYLYYEKNAYRDLSFGAGVHIFGHSPNFILNTIKQECEKVITTQKEYHNTNKLTKLLEELSGYKNFLICNTGAEGVQKALRIARVHSKSKKIVVFKNAWHGMVDDTLEEYNNAISQHDTIFLNRDKESLKMIDNKVGIVIVEPIPQRYPEFDFDFLLTLSEVCNKKNIILISDEIISGFRLNYSFNSDIKIFGKAISGGLPISIIAYKEWLREDFPKGGTYSGNNLSVSVALTTLQQLTKNDLSYLNGLGNTLRQILNENNIKAVGYGSMTRILEPTKSLFSNLYNNNILYPKNNIIYNAFSETIEDVINYGEKISEAYRKS